MNTQKIELLAPAGNFACFRAAINAGADAIYLGGEKFGARAYAGNFSKEEIIEALRIAHLFERKIYLTVNTLVKESEFDELVPYLEPLYEAGLDGAIIQDIGVLRCLRKNFPNLALHASTQMTITGIYGASYLKRLGVCRVVPARELSLNEIVDMKNKTGLEIECFIHGAMCYAYSGQCLFSSILGQRSGNRGRCAGPCRLPYTDEKGKTLYPLSLKDMYTLSILPELIRAGIDSFKIEGRMKSPEYVAGVTSIYKKYIDMYLKNPNKPYRVFAEDEQLLKQLYIRSDICSGYYHKHNDKSMITLKEPGYSGSSEAVLKEIQKNYISKNITLPISGYVRIYAGEQAILTLSCENTSVTVYGDTASTAVNRPLDENEIKKQLYKFGDTCFVLTELIIDTDYHSFMPVKSLNKLRRQACIALESERIAQTSILRTNDLKCCDFSAHNKMFLDGGKKNNLCVLVTTLKQLQVVNSYSDIHRIYVDCDIFLCKKMERQNAQEDSYCCNFLCDEKIRNTLMVSQKEYILVMPHIFRKRTYQYFSDYEELLKSGFFSGVMIRNFEELEWLLEIGYMGPIHADYTIYTWNNLTLEFYSTQFAQITLPLELNKKELNMLNTADCFPGFVVYGYIPLMYSANCIKNTLEKCIKDVSSGKNRYHLTDRYNNVFLIVSNCMHCYNILYNTVPLSLHGQLEKIMKKNYGVLRLDFSIEDETQTRAVVEYYLNAVRKPDTAGEFPFTEFTNGHYKRGVE